MQSFVLLLDLESWEVMLVEETRDKARCFGPIVPGYEAYCVPLNSLHLVDVLLNIGVPDDGTELQRRIQAMEMRCYRKILQISHKDHVTNEEVPAKIQQAIGPHEDHLTLSLIHI